MNTTNREQLETEVKTCFQSLKSMLDELEQETLTYEIEELERVNRSLSDVEIMFIRFISILKSFR